MSFVSGIASALVEAWQELRINKVRILLALVAVAVSVAALTSVVGVGDLAREGFKVQAERQGGRTATVGISVYGPTGPLDPAQVDKAYQGIVERYGISYWTNVGQSQARFQFPQGVQDVQMTLVDPGYGVIHRIDMRQGSWFADDDAKRLAPAVVVSEAFYNAAGRPDLVQNPKVKTAGGQETTAVIIGVVPDMYEGMPPSAFMLRDSAAAAGITAGFGEFKVWLQGEQAESLVQAIQMDLQAQFPGTNANVFRQDYAAQGDPLAMAQIVVGAVAGLVLLLGAMGMLNISMVTIRYRVREIGIRRSFGATSGRIFVGVMMESLVASCVAGIAGVMLSIAVVKNPWIQSKVAPALDEYPPFPLEAAMLGFGAAVLVGALAGAIPALVAVRIKVIDAIRF